MPDTPFTLSPHARIRRQVTQRLSLRSPQERALEILADVADRIDWRHDVDAGALLTDIRGSYPTVESFERAFPSLCFALATGVGKTRLMGAFIAYLFLTGRSRNFFVLAPNTTIYDKLVEDFSRPSSAKYVFPGIGEFAQTPPTIITGENWELARGGLGLADAVINIFNVDKINKEKGRIRSFRETLGESYFEHLSAQKDLVMLMDEAHRYRAKAAANAVYELNPKLGLELTATPKTVGASPKAFRNVIYSYGLGQAMADGFVKEPAVATRANFNPKAHGKDELEQIMLEDGVTYHERVKVELELWHKQTGAPLVHPFMLVVAEDTDHARRLRETIESEKFFAGRYCGRVAEIHSNQGAEESNEAAARLVGLESDAATDIVIHVNKLKEGWDVRNLFTIVPLRASASDILTEQTLGRGLRLPYGKRTKNEMIDTLTVIAHRSFSEVIDAAKAPGSVLAMKEITLGDGGSVDLGAKEVLTVYPTYEGALTGKVSKPEAPGYTLPPPETAAVAAATLEVIRAKYERAPGGLENLKRPEVQAQIAADVQAAQSAAAAVAPQGEMFAAPSAAEVALIVEEVTSSVAENTIAIPEIVVLPSREVTFWYDDFDLSALGGIRLTPSGDTLLVRNLRTDAQIELARTHEGPRESRPENYIIRHLIALPEIDYDSQANLLYKLAGQMIAHLRSYLADEDQVEAAALEHGRKLADVIFEQMKVHYRESPADYRARLVRSFRLLKAQQFAYDPMRVKPLGEPAVPLSSTPSWIFAGGTKTPYKFNRFHSDPERRFAVLLESPPFDAIVRWLRPAPGQFDIEYHGGRRYNPDFVLETANAKIIVEVKAHNEMGHAEVQEKARAARAWVDHATALSQEDGGKRWHYVLLDEQQVSATLTPSALLPA
jgi:type III restriction enzyme